MMALTERFRKTGKVIVEPDGTFDPDKDAELLNMNAAERRKVLNE